MTDRLPNAEDRKKLSHAIKECSNSMTRIKGEREFIREAVKKVCTDLKLNKVIVNKMVRAYYKQNFNEELDQNEEFQILYESIVNGQQK